MGSVVFEHEKTSFLKVGYPGPAFGSLIEYYFELDAFYSQKDLITITGIPSINTLISINLGQDDWKSRNEVTGKEISISNIQLLGHTTHCFTGLYEKSAKVFCIKLKPGGLIQLFPYPAQQLENNQIEVSALFKSFSLEQFQMLPSFQARMSLFENYLTGLNFIEVDPHKQYKIDMFLKSFKNSHYQGRDNIDKLCRDHHITYATLRRYFVKHIGVSPKYCQKVIKFKSALQAYRTYGYKFNYEDFGYTDFSHFCKDAKQLTGCTPSNL